MKLSGMQKSGSGSSNWTNSENAATAEVLSLGERAPVLGDQSPHVAGGLMERRERIHHEDAEASIPQPFLNLTTALNLDDDHLIGTGIRSLGESSVRSGWPGLAPRWGVSGRQGILSVAGPSGTPRRCEHRANCSARHRACYGVRCRWFAERGHGGNLAWSN